MFGGSDGRARRLAVLGALSRLPQSTSCPKTVQLTPLYIDSDYLAISRRRARSFAWIGTVGNICTIQGR